MVRKEKKSRQLQAHQCGYVLINIKLSYDCKGMLSQTHDVQREWELPLHVVELSFLPLTIYSSQLHAQLAPSFKLL